MKNKLVVVFLSFLLLLFFGEISFSQTNCEGGKIFSEKKCLGDDLDPQEKELYKIVNEYRAKNNLPPVTFSNALSVVANRHLLDLMKNIKALSHGWSNCPFDMKDQSTWNCLFESPKRLNVGYSGNGFENLYRNLNGNATPILALEAWKKSELHNSLILNLENFKNIKFDAFGVAINGAYASLWFGSSGAVSNQVKNQNTTGLGVTFEKAVAGLTNSIAIKKASSGVQSEEWSGASPDRSVMLSMVGAKEDISRAEISIKIKIEKDSQISQKNRNILKTFLNNLVAEWSERNAWVDAGMKKLRQNPKEPQVINHGDKTLVLTMDKENYISITVKPFRKPTAKEIK